ncbi:MAG: shikimate kinase [Phycisphaerales bacterium]
MRLVLIGMRGSGKTTLGAALAAARGWRFVDLDVVTLEELGARSVAEAWSRAGEAGFREAESRALVRAVEDDPDILGLGGGTPTSPAAQAVIQGIKDRRGARARVVYLRGAPGVLAARVRASGDPDRPRLVGASVEEEMEEVYAARDPLYLSLADAVMDVTDQTVEAGVLGLGIIAERAAGVGG